MDLAPEPQFPDPRRELPYVGSNIDDGIDGIGFQCCLQMQVERHGGTRAHDVHLESLPELLPQDLHEVRKGQDDLSRCTNASTITPAVAPSSLQSLTRTGSAS